MAETTTRVVKIREPIHVKVTEYMGVARLDIRHFFINENGEACPTKKGISIPISNASELRMAIESSLLEWDNISSALGQIGSR